jgi:hypothetical protein
MTTQKKSLRAYVNPPLKQKVVTSARANGRTESKEIEYVLTAHYRSKK